MASSQRKERQKIASSFDGLFLKNPILICGLALPMAVVATTSLKNAAALSISMSLSAIPALVAASLFGKLHYRARILIEVLVASAMLIPAYFLIEPISPAIFDSLGIYFWMIGVSSFTLQHAQEYSAKMKPGWALLDAVICCIGIALALFLIAGVREYLGKGSLWDKKLAYSFPMKAALVPCGGFIVVSFLSAGFHVLRSKILKVFPIRDQMKQ